jgi:hypothetical protein
MNTDYVKQQGIYMVILLIILATNDHDTRLL